MVIFMSKIRGSLFLLACFSIVVLIYMPGLSGGFVLDDFPNLVDNQGSDINSLTFSELFRASLAGNAGPLKRPVAMLTLSIERYFFGLDPFPMKVTNLVIHLGNGLLIFLLLSRLVALPSVRPVLVAPGTLALLVALAWLVAPINLTGVLYVIQRMESLSTFFMLAGLLAYLSGRVRLEAGRGGALPLMWGGLILGGMLGVLSKESAVMLPVYALLIEWLFFGFGKPGSSARGAVVRLFVILLVVPGLIGLAWLLPRVFADPEFANRPFDVFDRLWTEARVLWHYLAWIIAPNSGALSLYHDAFPISRGALTPWTTLPAVLGLMVLTIGAVRMRHRFRLAAFGVLLFFVMHLLVSTVLNLELVYEHRNYLGSMGILLAAFALLLDGRVTELVLARRFAVAALIALYGFLSFLRASEWSDPVQLAYFEATRQVDSPRAQYGLGLELTRLSPPPDSPTFSIAMNTWREAAVLPNTTLLPWHGLIYEHARHGLPIDSAWWEGVREYVRTRPLSAQDRTALYTLIDARTNRDILIPIEPLREVIEAAREANPNHALLMTLHANFLLNVVGEARAAEPLLYEAVARKPEDPAVWRNLITFQLAVGQLDRAAASIDRLEAINRLGLESETIARFRAELAQRRAAAEERG